MAQQWSKVNRNHFVDLLITEQDYGKTTIYRPIKTTDGTIFIIFHPSL